MTLLIVTKFLTTSNSSETVSPLAPQHRQPFLHIFLFTHISQRSPLHRAGGPTQFETMRLLVLP